MASIFNPKDGTAQEWITSSEVTIRWIFLKKGRMTRLSTSNNRIKWFLLLI